MVINSHSGTYTLRQLLGEDLTIVIPDLQRDYCWGNIREGTQVKSKATAFVWSIIDMYRTRREGSLGLLYGYESPAGSSHILLIDGQQRLTTLYLLVGMLYRRTPREDLRRLLISDYELLDDREPRLIYQVRSEAMYFMSDLVTHFFLNRDGRLSLLEKSSWYCATYDTDSTIRSFIAAIREIDAQIEEACREKSWDFDDFADYVTDSLVLFYHDLGSQETAEKLFITINTTGEPLTQPQILKSLMLNYAGSHSEEISQWEEMERWAWKNRPCSGPENPTTDDRRLTELIDKYIYKEQKTSSIAPPRPGSAVNPKDEKALFEGLYRFFDTFRTLVKCVPEAIDTLTVPADMLALLPTLEYIQRWHLSDKNRETVNDVYQMLKNVSRYQRLSPYGSEIATAIGMVRQMRSPHITTLLELPAGAYEKILTIEETSKLKLIQQYRPQQARVTRLIRRAEAHPLLTGCLHKVIGWSYDKARKKIDLQALETYIDTIYEVWGTDIDCCARLDTLRRALLTLRHPGYPMVRRGNSTLSLCWSERDWQRLMQQTPGAVRMILDKVISAHRRPIDTLNRAISRFSEASYPYYFLIRDHKLIGKIEYRCMLQPSQPFIGLYEAYSTGGDTPAKLRTIWYIEQRPINIDTGAWRPLRSYGQRCLYTDHLSRNIAIDLHYQPEKRMSYRLEVFSRPTEGPQQKKGENIRALVDKSGKKFTFDKNTGRFIAEEHDSASALSTLYAIMKI